MTLMKGIGIVTSVLALVMTIVAVVSWAGPAKELKMVIETNSTQQLAIDALKAEEQSLEASLDKHGALQQKDMDGINEKLDKIIKIIDHGAGL